MKFRMIFEFEEDCVDTIELAESRAMSVAQMMESECDMDLTIVKVEEVDG